MKSLGQRFIFILISFAFIIAAFIVYSNFIKPEYETVSELRAQAFSKADTLVRYEASFMKLQNMLNGQNIGQVRDSVSRILPSSVDMGYLSAQLVGFAKLNNLSVLSLTNSLDPIKSSKSKVIKSVGVVKTQLSVAGGYGNIKSFVQQIENNLLLMDVTSLQIKPNDQKETSLPMAYTLTIMSYYQVQ